MTSNAQLKQLKNTILAIAMLFALISALALPEHAYAKDTPNTLPSLAVFIDAVKDGNAGVLRGVYVSNVLALRVVQQPVGDPAYVSLAQSAATQFNKASESGNIGLLAHNFLAGGLFSNIKKGDQVFLVYGDGRIESFTVDNISRYQAMNPTSERSEFKNLDTQASVTADQLFDTMYRGAYHLTLQTCIENNGDLSWGRLFITATPSAAKTTSAVNKD